MTRAPDAEAGERRTILSANAVSRAVLATPRATACDDCRHLALDLLAASERRLRDCVADVEIERNTYREMAHAALDALADLTHRYTALQARMRRLLQEFRRVHAR